MDTSIDNAVALDQAIASLWHEGHRLDMVIRMLCDMESVSLEGRGLEGFRNLLGGVLDAMDAVEEAYKATDTAKTAQEEYHRRAAARRD